MNHLHSLTVLSLEQATTLPFLTLRLAMEGMRVIRLESPPRGDPNRWVGRDALPGAEPGMQIYFLPNNLGKQAITLNLGTEEGRALLHRLVRELPVDIFATNQRPRSYEKLGIDPATLHALKPDLIWVGISGFGPEHDEAAYDPILQARAGYMELTGEPGGPPTVFGLPMIDLGAGEHAYGQIMKALYQRALTGEGARINISMFQSAVSWMVAPILLSQSFGEHVTRRGNTHQFFGPVSVFPTADGYVYLAVGNDRQWEALTALPGFDCLAREEYRRNVGRMAGMTGLLAELAAITGTRTNAELIAACQGAGIPISPVHTLDQVAADPLIAPHLVRARDPRSGAVIAIPPPPVITPFLCEHDMTLAFPPRLGEHNREVFGKLGVDAGELQARGVI
jgi:crotonobetainyl-CoA:carnitine CoA-transferase CaiB-like acyl-CoA transferase